MAKGLCRALHIARKVTRRIDHRVPGLARKRREIGRAIAEDRAHPGIRGVAAPAMEMGELVTRRERGVGEGAAEEDRSAQDEDSHAPMVTTRRLRMADARRRALGRVL